MYKTYVISDIHGMYDEFLELLSKINFDDTDTLYILGDIIDRGPKIWEMYLWVKERINKNVFMVLGNHEDEFVTEALGYRGYLLYLEKSRNNKILTEIEQDPVDWFINNCFYSIEDRYGTINYLLNYVGISIDELEDMANFFNKLPLYYEVEKNGKVYTLVHASCDSNLEKTSRNEFIWSRILTNKNIYVKNRNVIFGHTPTICEEYNGVGGIQQQTNKFGHYKANIDCGAVYGIENSKLGILCLDTLEEFYIDTCIKK